MTDFPLAATLTGGAVTQGGFKTALDQLVAAIGERNQRYALTAGTGTAYTMTHVLSPIPSYADGVPFFARIHTANTGAATANIDGRGAKAIRKDNNQALVAGDLQADDVVILVYVTALDVLVLVNTIRQRQSFSAHKNSVDQTGIVSSTATLITFTSELWDIGGCYVAASSRFQPTVAGKYRVSACIRWPTGAWLVDQEQYAIRLYKNGVHYRDMASRASGTSTFNQFISDLVDMNGSSDYIEVWAFHGAVAAAQIAGLAIHSWFSGEAI